MYQYKLHTLRNLLMYTLPMFASKTSTRSYTDIYKTCCTLFKGVEQEDWERRWCIEHAQTPTFGHVKVVSNNRPRYHETILFHGFIQQPIKCIHIPSTSLFISRDSPLMVRGKARIESCRPIIKLLKSSSMRSIIP